jgi:phage tail sheath protein FI
MAQLKFGSAGVTAREIDLSGPVTQQPVGVPAGVVGTALKGPAFVPITVGRIEDFYAKFGKTDGKKFGPLAVTEWLRNARAVTYLRVLGVGDGRRRQTDGATAGAVTSAGFVVGEDQPRDPPVWRLAGNEYANSGSLSVPGRTYFLGCFMSESLDSTVFSQAGLQGTGSVTPGLNTAVPIIRGVLLAASGVILRLSAAYGGDSSAPASSLIATDSTAKGALTGTVVLMENSVAKQEFVVLLNGHRGTDPLYPNVITASFDMTSPNYFANVMNSDPMKYQQAGHYLYANWDVHPITATVTGSGVIVEANGSGGVLAARTGAEACAFITTGALGRNVGSATVPNYENFEDRYGHAVSPWVISQRFGGNEVDLFKLHALDAGAGVSTLYKVSIENIAPSSDPAYKYGQFDVVIRDWNDRDGSTVPLEQWRGLSLDPSSDRYIAKVIGDTHVYYDFDRAEASQKLVVDGNYANASNYVRVEVSDSVDTQAVDPSALPFGVRGVAHLVTSGSMPLTSVDDASQLTVVNAVKRAVTPPLPMRKDITTGADATRSVNPLLYWGAQFEHVTSLSMQNASTMKNESLESFVKYFPNFMVANVNFVEGDNAGAVDTTELGVIDSDRFCLNKFSLENIRIVTGSDGLANSQQWDKAFYVRKGGILPDDAAKTRKLTPDDLTQGNRKYVKYTFVVQGGFDGVNIFNTDESQLNNNAVTGDLEATNRGQNEGPSVRAYVKALEIMKNVVNTDIQLLAIPGIRHHVLTDAALDAVQLRFDALYVADIEEYDNVNELVTSDATAPSVLYTAQNFRDRAIDSSFGAAYFPNIVMTDPNTNTNVVVPPSVQVLGAFALNDALGHPWFAPAGFTRGALASALETKVWLSKDNMDTLYDVNINPIVAFPGNAQSGTNPKGGCVVWGQKTLQAAASALDRVNVRRLLIEIRRQVREISQTIIFEANRAATLARFSAAVTPRLQRIQAQAGLQRFKVIIDSSTTTQQDIENNTIRGKIYVQPTKSIEYVSLDFVVTNNIQQTP